MRYTKIQKKVNGPTVPTSLPDQPYVPSPGSSSTDRAPTEPRRLYQTTVDKKYGVPSGEMECLPTGHQN